MGFDDQQNSVESGAPIELFLFEGESTFAYTTGPIEYTYLGHTFTPVAMRRTVTSLSPKEQSGQMVLKMPFNDPFVTRYVRAVPPSPERLTVYQVHLSEDEDPANHEVRTMWRGYVSGVRFTETDARVSLSTQFSRIGTQIPKRTFSWACNHVLFDARCKVAKAQNQVYLNVLDIDAERMQLIVENNAGTIGDTFETRAAADDTYFRGGLVDAPYGGDSRMVIKVELISDPGGEFDGKYRVYLMVPMDQLQTGEIITLTAGCDRAVGTCFSRFDNVQNYGGFPFVPTTNPFSSEMKRETGRVIRTFDSNGDPILVPEETE